MKTIVALLSVLTFHFAVAQEEEEWWPERQPINEVTVQSEDGRVSLKIKVQHFDRNELRHEELEDEDRVYAGKERLPVDVLYYQPCLVRSFELSIEGKRVELDERLWKDVGGFGLCKLPDLPKNATDEQKERYEIEMEDPGMMPQIRYSEMDGNYMIIWKRGADCDSSHTIYWIVSKDGKMIMRHLDIPPHHC